MSLPSLAQVSPELHRQVNGELLYQLAAALARRGLGTPEMYDAGKGVEAFVQSAVLHAIGPKRLKTLANSISYGIEIADTNRPSYYGEKKTAADHVLFKVACSEYGYLEIGSAIEAMEAEAPDLGAAFYRTLVRSVRSVMRIYDYGDALLCEESQREMAAQDGDNEDAYEIPDILSEIPECLRRLEKRKQRPSHRTLRHYRRLLQSHCNGRFGAWIKMLRRLQVFARFSRRESKNYAEEDPYYDDPPIPSMLIVFQKHDGIARCFDEEAEYWAQGSPEPGVCIKFSPANPEEVAHTLRIAYRFFEFNCELSRMAQDIEKWEARRAHNRRHRADAEVSTD